MKLSTREKKLLVLLGIVLGVTLFYKVIFKPNYEKIQELRDQKAQIQAMADQVQEEIAEYSQLKRESETVNAKIAYMTQPIYPTIFQEKIILMLDEMLADTSLKVTSMVFSEPTSMVLESPSKELVQQENSLKQFVKLYQNAIHMIKNTDGEDLEQEQYAGEDKNLKKAEEQGFKGDVEQMSVTLLYQGSYESLIEFMKKLEAYDKKTIIQSINIENENTIDKVNFLSGAITLDFYAVPKIHYQDEEYLTWSLEDSYGKNNPFNLFSGYKPPSQQRDQDFVIHLHPYLSGLPTVILGKEGYMDSNSFIYAVNNGIEDIELHILQKDGQYYFRYKTREESYPLDYQYEMMPFIPLGNSIEIKINSQDRSGEHDQSGINFTVINQSNLDLNITIYNDDSFNPRVNVIKKMGSITVNNMGD